MKNKPNGYRILYKVRAGAYAGGLGDRTKDVSNEEELAKFLSYHLSHVTSVTPVFLEIGKPLSQNKIDEIRLGGIKKGKEIQAQNEVEYARKRLERAEGNLEKLTSKGKRKSLKKKKKT